MTRAEYSAWEAIRRFEQDPPLKVDRIFVEPEARRLVVDLLTDCGVSFDTLLFIARAVKSMAVVVEPVAGPSYVDDPRASLRVTVHKVPPEMFQEGP